MLLGSRDSTSSCQLALLLRWAGFVAGVAATTQAVELLALFSPASLVLRWAAPFSPHELRHLSSWMGTVRLCDSLETCAVQIIRASVSHAGPSKIKLHRAGQSTVEQRRTLYEHLQKHLFIQL